MNLLSRLRSESNWIGGWLTKCCAACDAALKPVVVSNNSGRGASGGKRWQRRSHVSRTRRTAACVKCCGLRAATATCGRFKVLMLFWCVYILIFGRILRVMKVFRRVSCSFSIFLSLSLSVPAFSLGESIVECGMGRKICCRGIRVCHIAFHVFEFIQHHHPARFG